MNILIVHNNFPGQFIHLAEVLAQRGHTLAAIGSGTARPIPNVPVNLRRFVSQKLKISGVPSHASRFIAEAVRAELAAMEAKALQAEGFNADLIIGHPGWGEMLFLQEIWPRAKMISYAEFYFHTHDSVLDFDPEFRTEDLQRNLGMRVRNAAPLQSLVEADAIVCPMEWQRGLFPASIRDRFTVLHEGIDTQEARPRPDATVTVEDGTVLRVGDEVVTYVNRHLEPLRGMHIFMRALPDILAKRPNAHVLIMGADDGNPYLSPPSGKGTWKQIFVREVADRVDPRRVHWLGRVDKSIFFRVLAVSRAHIYLTYPFTLSWSLLDSMSVGCTVIASATAPVAEVVEDGRNGLLVDFFDSRALAQTVADVLARPMSDFERMRRAARNTVIDRYDRDTITLPGWLRLIDRVC